MGGNATHIPQSTPIITTAAMELKEALSPPWPTKCSPDLLTCKPLDSALAKPTFSMSKMNDLEKSMYAYKCAIQNVDIRKEQVVCTRAE